MEDWVLYFSEDEYHFSESFKKELSSQLEKKLKSKLEYENFFQDYFYSFIPGANELEIEEKDDFVSPDSQSRQITICWRSDFF